LLRAYLEIVRVFLTPSAAADSYAGLVVASARAGTAPPGAVLAAVVGTSVLIYWLGMAANDIFDRAKDLEVAPSRPIPSGRIPIARAILLSTLLAAGALLLAAFAGVILPAAALISAALLYDVGLKRVPVLGSLVMGLCRALNFLLGASAIVGPASAAGDRVLLGAAGILGLYIAMVTRVSELEDAPPEPAKLRARALPTLMVPAVLVLLRPAEPLAWLNGVLLAALLIEAFRAGTKISGPIHGAALFVRKALGGIFLVDAGLVLGLSPAPARPMIPFITLYGLFALAWAWKRTWIRRGSMGS
jgi:4-hydroxybenzoate polyprenyltransferase